MKSLLLIPALVAVANLLPGGSAAQESPEANTYYAFSLRAAAERLAKPGSPDSPLIQRLGGLTRITGLVVDPVSKDCILVGRIDPTWPESRLDDLIVMLRSVFLHRDMESPGVSIDPDPDQPLAKPQRVRVFGHIEHSRAADVCYRADLLMKRIALGLESARVAGVRSYWDGVVEEARAAGGERSQVLSRFWYFPVVCDVVNLDSGVLLDECQLAVLTEVLSAEVGGEQVRDLDQFHHEPSERYARTFSDHFDELAEAWPAIRDLRSLAVLAALCRELATSAVRPDLEYWLNEYQVPVVPTPAEVPLLQNMERQLQLVVYGGVCLQALSLRLKEGDANAFSDAVLQARPSPGELLWHITVTDEGNIFVPPSMDRLRIASAADASVRGHHLFSARRYDQAISHWLQVTRAYPEMGEAFYHVGRAFERKRMPVAAAYYYSKALQADPFLKNSRLWNWPGAVVPGKELVP